MILRVEPISLTALVLLAILLGFVTWDHVKPEPDKQERPAEVMDLLVHP